MLQIFKLEWPKFEFVVVSSRYVVTLQFMTHNTLSTLLIASITEALNIYSLSPVSCNATVPLRNHCIPPRYRHTAVRLYYNHLTVRNVIKPIFALSACRTMIN
jgi:hypothetical protein